MEKDTTDACEEVLLRLKRYNEEHGISQRVVAIGDRLLARRVELQDAYAEVYGKLRDRPAALENFLEAVLATAAHWNPEKIAEVREGRERIEEINSEIAELADKLAELVDERDDLEEDARFSSDAHQDALEVVVKAAADNPRFQLHVREQLEALICRFDERYWPTLGDVMREISADASQAETCAHDPITRAATTGPRNSLSGFFRALFEAIRLRKVGRSREVLPEDFALTDNTLASFANCALDLGADEPVDGAYVKRFRQRERAKADEARHREDGYA